MLGCRKDRLVALLSIDFTKAFDNAWWSDIVNNMINYDYPTHLIHIISGYLSDRLVTFTFNGANSSKSITKSCPQGNPLSPILWSILINPLLLSSFSAGTTVVAYADDISVVCADVTAAGLADKIQSSLDVVKRWSIESQVNINAQKTNIINFHRETLPLPIRLGGRRIEVVTVVKVLGLTFSSHRSKSRLNFNPHVETVLRKVGSLRNCLLNFCKNTYGMNTVKRKNLYKGLLRPVIAYGSEIWLDFALGKHKKKLESFQHTILRNAVRAYRTVSQSCVTVLSGVEPIVAHMRARQLRYQVGKGLRELSPGVTLAKATNEIRLTALQQVHIGTDDNFKFFFLFSLFLSISILTSLTPNFSPFMGTSERIYTDSTY